MSYLDSVVEENPNLASSYVADQTYEKRNLRVIVLKDGSPSKAIWLGKYSQTFNSSSEPI